MNLSCQVKCLTVYSANICSKSCGVFQCSPQTNLGIDQRESAEHTGRPAVVNAALKIFEREGKYSLTRNSLEWPYG